MPKRHYRVPKRLLSEENNKTPDNSGKSDHFVLEIILGLSNVKRWNKLKITFSCTTNEEFATFLLNLAEKHLKEKEVSKPAEPQDILETPTETAEIIPRNENTKNERKSTQTLRKKSRNKKYKKIKTKEVHDIEIEKTEDGPNLANLQLDTTFKSEADELNEDKVIEDVEMTKLDVSVDTQYKESHNGTHVIASVFDNSVLKDNRISNSLSSKSLGVEENESLNDKENKNSTIIYKKSNDLSYNESDPIKNNLLEICTPEKSKKRSNGYDIRKAPELNEQVDSNFDNLDVLKCEESNRVAIKIKLCCTCGTRHIQDHCPVHNPHYIVNDSLNHEEWTQKYKSFIDKEGTVSEDDVDNESNDHNDKNTEKDINFTFAFLSVPNILCLNNSNIAEEMGVFVNSDIKEFTQFGPLCGKIVKEVDIPEDFNMKQLWEINCDKSHVYVNTENINESNWIRFVRPAPTRDERNVIAVSRNGQLFFVSIKCISTGEELLYWQDDVSNTTKKKMEKTTCGGCNVTFAHPLYYRIHCSIFHDMRYSLTIRKYHCKVCGAAVLGKENIMKHAAELHNGQGAYQCQFCKKFFLRLNYLEMHRTYGCSANPHRSRPLCDFCGRKFCQPQKLKVHIKRMHSDLSEVLKEFQCKNCLKLLGSRAALQRHMKEVHNKQMNGACACNRCGKLFQNKSNLKIHMLTHSGIKPFRCAEGICNAAFTTKQCLQFHYKKVHNFTDDRMPKIERSVDYTFEAYSGLEDQEQETDEQDTDHGKTNDDCEDRSNFMGVDTGSDEDNDDNVEDNNLDNPPSLHSPEPIINEHSSGSNTNPTTLEPYTNLKIISKGSKKWLGEQTLPTLKSDIYHIATTQSNKTDDEISLDVDETQSYEPLKLNMNLNAYSRHESSNASLLVEAALDSVTDIHCNNESNININTTSSSTDALVNNLCTLGHSETLSDVAYAHSVDIGESRDINLISPTVNDSISVSDANNIRIDYSSFHHNDFSPANSPDLHQRSFSRDYIDVGQVSPHNIQGYTKSKNPSPGSSPPRYNFGHGIGTDHISSDDSNGIGAQNLSLHDSKNDSQLDLSIYKSPYGLDATSFQLRKDFGMKFNFEAERKQLYVLEINETAKLYHENAVNESNLASESTDRDQVEDFDSGMCNKDFENMENEDLKHKNSELKTKYHDVEQLSSEMRNKQFDLDLNLRSKGYDVSNRSPYDSVVDVDFRIKNYDGIESTETRNALNDEFRNDRNFEPLVLNSNELQGLDMTARSYHNYHTSSSVQNLNRYHHIYPDVDRPSVDLRLNYSPPLPSYTHADVLRVVSLDLTSPGRHSVDLSLRSNPLHVHQLGNSRLLSEHSIQANRILTDHNRLTLDQSRLLSTDPARLLSSDLSTNRHLNGNSRLLSVAETGNRIISDHSTNRLLSNEQISNHLLPSEQSRLISDESRLISDQPRLLEQSRLLTESRILSTAAVSGSVSPLPYASYSVSPTPYHPTALTNRSHTSSPIPPYHPYSNYY